MRQFRLTVSVGFKLHKREICDTDILSGRIFLGWRERSGERKAGALFEIGIHNSSARDGVEAVFRTFTGHNPLKRLDSEK
jgi:hypothetical protein